MSDGKFESAWNTSGSMADEIMRLRIKANVAYVDGNYSLATKHLVAIKMTIIASLDEDEKKELNEMERNFLKFDSFNKMIHPHKKSGDDFRKLQIKIADLFLKFNNSLMVAIHNHKLGLGEKENTYDVD